MSAWVIFLVCSFCWLNGAMYGWIFRELREKKQFLDKAKNGSSRGIEIEEYKKGL